MCGGNDTGFFGWVEFIDPPVVKFSGLLVWVAVFTMYLMY